MKAILEPLKVGTSVPGFGVIPYITFITKSAPCPLVGEPFNIYVYSVLDFCIT